MRRGGREEEEYGCGLGNGGEMNAVEGKEELERGSNKGLGFECEEREKKKRASALS